jgi:uncharacterized protein YqfA (UPF0365 family)
MNDASDLLALVAALVVLLIMLAMFAVFLAFFRDWIRAFLYGCHVSIFTLIGARLRGNPPGLLVDAYISLRRAGFHATMRDVENTYIDARPRAETSDELVEILKRRAAAEGKDHKPGNLGSL